MLIHDTTEREIPRPSNPEVQADFYSGKKKKHTVKNAVITTLTGLVLFVGATVPGKTPVIRAMNLATQPSFNPQRSLGERNSPQNRKPKTKSFLPLGSKLSMPFPESRTKEWSKTFVDLERTILSTRLFALTRGEGGGNHYPCPIIEIINNSGAYVVNISPKSMIPEVRKPSDAQNQ